MSTGQKSRGARVVEVTPLRGPGATCTTVGSRQQRLNGAYATPAIFYKFSCATRSRFVAGSALHFALHSPA